MSDADHALTHALTHARPTVLAVAGLDPSGGAGIALDAAVLRAFGVHPLTALTGVAVQNTVRFARRHDLPAALVKEQIATVTEEFQVGAVKTGMLGTREIVEVLAAWLAERPRLPLILDPVLQTTSGGDLGESGYQEALVRVLVPRARVLTPNLAEASALSGVPVAERAQVPDAARALLALGAEWVLVKGGHLSRGWAADYLASADGGTWFEETVRSPGDVRGTGCALASAIAAGLARGEAVTDAVKAAKNFVTAAIDAAYPAGVGRFLGVRPR
jgi:hydroxymethylpyrimidine/phosphomethylpyrimidine kinase